MGFLNDQLKRVEIERRKGRKVKTYRRRIVREMARLWEKTTGDAPTISDGCGFLFALGVVWDATAREAHAWIDMREGLAARAGRTFNHGLDLSHLEPGVEDMRNELRAVLNEGKS
jgi:hypothetical protein